MVYPGMAEVDVAGVTVSEAYAGCHQVAPDKPGQIAGVPFVYVETDPYTSRLGIRWADDNDCESADRVDAAAARAFAAVLVIAAEVYEREQS